MPELLLTTMPGLEPLAAEECRELGIVDPVTEPGRVLAAVAGSDVASFVHRLNGLARCLDRVGILLARANVEDLDACEAVVREAPLLDWLAPGCSFAVRAVRRGEHDFRSPDLAGAVGAAVIDAARTRRGDRPPVNLDDPDVVLRVDLEGKRMLLWLDTTGDRALHHRTWRIYTHMASMRPTVANLLLRLAGEISTLVDPFCGGGTLPIEAVLRARGVAPARMRPGPWAWQRIPPLAGPVPVLESEGAAVLPAVFGIERFRGHLRGAHDNAARAGVAAYLRLIGGRAEQLDRIGPKGVFRDATIVTNPPFGRRVANAAMIERLYAAAAAAFALAGIGKVVTLAERGDLMEGALVAADFSIRQRIAAIYGDTPVTVFVADRGD